MKIVILGVGSTYFTRSLIESLIAVGGSWEVGMVDIDPRPLDVAVRLGKRLVALYGADITISGSTDRCDVLENAFAVVSVIGVGGRKGWMADLLLGRRHGAFQTTADTAGIGGLSRALRTVPQLLAITSDMERLCPEALLVNFSNPMTVNCRALADRTSIRTVGLCTGVRSFHHRLANLLHLDPKDVLCHAIGVNHFTWITKLSRDGEDLLPMLHKRVGDGEVLPGGRFTTELFRIYGAYPVVGDHHISEFFPNLLRENGFYGATLGFDHETDTAVKYFESFDQVEADMAAEADGEKKLEKVDFDKRQYSDEDFFAELLLALRGDRELRCTVNLPNLGQCPSLPENAVLESTAIVNSSGIQPFCMGGLPSGIATILSRIIAVQELTAEAAASGSRNMAIQTLLADLAAGSLSEAEAIIDDILETHREHLRHIDPS